MNVQWVRWVHEVTGHASTRQIARRTGISATAVTRWLAGEPPASAIVRIAVSYRVPVLEGLIAAGIIDPDDTDGLVALNRARTHELVAELRRRSKAS